MLRIIILVVLIVTSAGSVSSQTSLIINESIPEGRAQVFTALADIMPPYEVVGEVNNEYISALIYINGVRVFPEFDFPKQSNVESTNEYDKYSQDASELQRQLTAEGYSHDRIVEALANYFRKHPGVINVTLKDRVTLDIEYRNGQHITRLVTPIKGTLDQGVDMLVNRVRRELESGKAIVFTSAPTLYVKPCDYDVLLQELTAVRNGAINDLQSYKWKVLTDRVVNAIIAAREEH